MNIICSIPDFPNKVLTFTNARTIITADDAVIPARTERSITLNSGGAGSIDLPVWAAGGAIYQVRVAGRYEVGRIIVSADGAPDLATLLDLAGVDLPTATALESRVAALEDAVTGAGIADRTYRHVQSSPAAVWTVAHDLGKYPAVDIVDSTRRSIYGGVVDYLDTNTLTITFASAFSGEAYIN